MKLKRSKQSPTSFGFPSSRDWMNESRTKRILLSQVFDLKLNVTEDGMEEGKDHVHSCCHPRNKRSPVCLDSRVDSRRNEENHSHPSQWGPLTREPGHKEDESTWMNEPKTFLLSRCIAKGIKSSTMNLTHSSSCGWSTKKEKGNEWFTRKRFLEDCCHFWLNDKATRGWKTVSGKDPILLERKTCRSPSFQGSLLINEIERLVRSKEKT